MKVEWRESNGKNKKILEINESHQCSNTNIIPININKLPSIDQELHSLKFVILIKRNMNETLNISEVEKDSCYHKLAKKVSYLL